MRDVSFAVFQGYPYSHRQLTKQYGQIGCLVCLFNYAANSAQHVASNGKINEMSVGTGMEGSGRGLFKVLSRICLDLLKVNTRIAIRVVSFVAQI